MDKHILAEIELVANDMAKLEKSQAREKEELKSLFRFIFTSKPEHIKRALGTLPLEQKLLLKSLLEKANAANWQGIGTGQAPDPKKAQDWLTKPVKSQIDEDMDAPDERLMDYHVDAVKHQGDNEPKGFDGQVVHDPVLDKNGQHKNPGQMKGKQPRVTGGAYEPEHVLNRENLVKPSKEEQLKDEEEQKEGRHRTLLPIKNEDIEINKKVRKEADAKEKKLLNKASNPDAKADEQLAEKVEELVSTHMKRNESAERKEGHSIYKAAPAPAPKPASSAPAAPSAPMNLFNPSSLPQTSAQPVPSTVVSGGHQAFGKAGSLVKHVPGVPDKKFDDCVEDVKGQPGAKNAYAICTASLKKGEMCKCEKCMKKSQELESKKVALANQSKNEEDHKDGLSKADIEDFAKKTPDEQLSKEQEQKELNKYEWFKDQKSPWASEEKKESAKMKKEQDAMKQDYSKRSGLEKSEVNPEMPSELSGELAEHEKNKMTPWDEAHPDLKREYERLQGEYAKVQKALSSLATAYKSFKSLEKSLERPQDASVKNEGDEKRNTSMRASLTAEKPEKGHDLAKSDEIQNKHFNPDPNARREEAGKKWGYDWNIKEIGRTESGKVIYQSEHPSEEGFSSKDHEDAANLLKRMREEAPGKQQPVAEGSMESDEQMRECINHHLKMMEAKAKMERENKAKLKKDLAEPEQDRSKQENLAKSRPVVWGTHVSPVLAGFKGGRNAHYDVDKTIVAAAIVGQTIQKTRWTDGGHLNEPLKKSINTSINEMIEKNLDKSPNDLRKAQELLESKPVGAFTVKSFEDADLVKSLHLSKEEEARVLEAFSKKK